VVEVVIAVKRDLGQAVRIPPAAPSVGEEKKLLRWRGRKLESLVGVMLDSFVSWRRTISGFEDRSSISTSPHLPESPKPLTFLQQTVKVLFMGKTDTMSSSGRDHELLAWTLHYSSG
jgi:hypothetical protein